MSELSELEGRITAALARIGKGLEAMPFAAPSADVSADQPAAAPADLAELASLREALAAERDANAQMNERLKAVKERHDADAAALGKKIEKLTQQLDVQGLEVQRMRKSNIQLRENLRALRDANKEGLAEPHLINKAVMAELEALRASRLSEMAEMDEILSELSPLIGEPNDA